MFRNGPRGSNFVQPSPSRRASVVMVEHDESRKSLLNCYSHGGSRIEVDDVIVGAMNIEELFDEEPMSKQTIGQGGNLWKLKMGSSEHLPLRESPQRSISNPLPHFSILFHAPKYSMYMPLRFPVYGVPLEKILLAKNHTNSSGALYSTHFLVPNLLVSHSLWNSFSSSIAKHSRECLSQACFLNIRCGSSEFVFSGYGSRPFPVNLTIYPDKETLFSKLRYVGADYLKPIKPSSADERRSPLPGKWNALKPTE
ncbi:hypothetical protein F5876DRAFT_63765 [Lentinula aff. lateritia]|uniref:Uncharacterized protein n=1 Tax=Lentinula aff. lateritia TaxID=2804960 RepID=A0ACC1U7B5_9AGAR|nr:hypothetical protein F5876DRAFT_63765 [Lentinula aff. lateritia]